MLLGLQRGTLVLAFWRTHRLSWATKSFVRVWDWAYGHAVGACRAEWRVVHPSLTSGTVECGVVGAPAPTQ